MKKKILSWALIIEIVTFSIIMSFMSPVSVLALSAGGLQTTIASIIISLMLECGAAPVNQSWINAVNNSYGIESSIGTIQDCINNGLLTQSGNTLIDTGLSSMIESQSAYTELKLGELFATSADDVANGVVAASGGVNLANVAINCGTLGTIGAFAGAAAVGIGLGVLANKVYNYVLDYAKYGLPMSYDNVVLLSNNFPEGYNKCLFFMRQNISNQYDQNTNYYFGKGNILYAKVDNYNSFYRASLVSHNFGEEFEQVRRLYINSNLLEETRPIAYKNSTELIANYVDGFNIFTNAKEFSSKAEFDNYVNDIKNNVVPFPENYAPDVITKNGNMTENDNIGSVVPDGYDMKPVDIDNYQDYSDVANDNTENDNVGQPIQGENFDNLIDSLLVEPSIIPDQGVTDPDVPDRPIIPDQPDVPGKDPITQEQQSDVLEGITTPDLRSVFPFCIPFDLFSLLGELKDANREAPVIVWEMPDELGGYSIILDFSMFDDAAALLRLLELAVFIVGLAVETRNLIGAKG